MNLGQKSFYVLGRKVRQADTVHLIGTTVTQAPLPQASVCSTLISHTFARSQEEETDLLLAHWSISRFHAAIVHGSENGSAQACVIDLGSKHGTFIAKGENKIRLVANIAHQLHEGTVLAFGSSSRRYTVTFNGNQQKMVAQVAEVATPAVAAAQQQDSNGAKAPGAGNVAFGGKFVSAGLQDVEGKVGEATGKRKGMTEHWQDQSFGSKEEDEKRKDKFMRLMGAKK